MMFLKSFLLSLPLFLAIYIVYFIRKREGRQIRTPLYRLGGKQKLDFRQVTFQRPPLLPLVFLTCFGLGVFFSFLPLQVHLPQASKSDQQLWIYVDHVLGSHLSFFREKPAKLIEDFESWKAQLPFHDAFLIQDLWTVKDLGVSYELEAYSPEKLQTYFKKNVVPWGNLFSYSAMQLLFQNLSFESSSRPKLVIIGQRENLRDDTQKIKEFFDEILIYETTPFESLLGKGEEIVPANLFEAWTGKSVKEEFVSLKGDSIPQEARPGWFKEVFSEDFQVVSGWFRSHEGVILSLCDLLSPSIPFFLDPLSEITDFAHFFQYPSRFVECDDQSSFAQDIDFIDEVWEDEKGFDKWTFRRPSLWIADFNQSRLNLMAQEHVLWKPKHFHFDLDRLVLLPLTDDLEGQESLFSFPDTFIEFWATLFPVPTTHELHFGSIKGKFQSFLSIKDMHKKSDEPVFFQFEDRAFLSRLPSTLPRREFSRTLEWINFWQKLFLSFKGEKALGVTVHQWESFEDFILDEGHLIWSSVEKILDPYTLSFRAWSIEEGVLPGLYLNDKNEFILLEFAKSAREISHRLLSNEPLKLSQSSLKLLEPQKPFWQTLTLILTVLCLGVLWLNPKKLLIFFLFCLPQILSAFPSSWSPFSFFKQRPSFESVSGLPIKACYHGVADAETSWQFVVKTIEKYTSLTLAKDLFSCEDSQVHLMILGESWQSAPTHRVQSHLSSGGLLILEQMSLSHPSVFRRYLKRLPYVELHSIIYGQSSFANSFFRLEPFPCKAYEMHRRQDPFFPMGVFLEGQFFTGNHHLKAQRQEVIVNVLMAGLTTNYKTQQLGADLAGLSRIEKRKVYQ
jgi:hypothetical protein